MDQLGIQLGKPPRVNIDAAIDKVLEQGGWTQIEHIINAGGSVGRFAPTPALPGAPESSGGPAVAALQNLGNAGA